MFVRVRGGNVCNFLLLKSIAPYLHLPLPWRGWLQDPDCSHKSFAPEDEGSEATWKSLRQHVGCCPLSRMLLDSWPEEICLPNTAH